MRRFTVKDPRTGFVQLTKRQIIEHYKQQAHYLGELGYSTNFSMPNAFFRSTTNQVNRVRADSSGRDTVETDNSYGEVEMLEDAVRDADRTVQQLLQGQRLLQDSRNKSVLAATEADIDDQLRANGKTDDYLASMGLRRKVVELIEMTTGKPEPDGVTMMVHVPNMHGSKDDFLKVNLPREASVKDVFHMLERFIVAELSYVGKTVMGSDFPWTCKWRYKISSHDRRMPHKEQAWLDTDQDYAMLVDSITNRPYPTTVTLSNANIRILSAFQDIGRPPAEEGSVEGIDNLIDEEGNRFFDPTDWDRIAERIMDRSII